MSRRVPAALAVLSLLAAPAWSQFTAEEFKSARQDPKMYTLDENSIRIERVNPPLEKMPEPLKTGPSAGDIVNTGLQVWKIIEENKPVVNVATQFATALPKGAKSWTDMAQWKPPIGTQYHLSAKNMYGATVVDVQYQVLRTYGGHFNGKGLYLTDVTVSPMPDGISVLWGYHFSLATTVPESGIVNVGTTDAPIAGMTVQTAWHISTALKESQGQGTYFVEGNGGFQEIAGPPEALKKARAATAAAAASAARFN